MIILVYFVIWFIDTKDNITRFLNRLFDNDTAIFVCQNILKSSIIAIFFLHDELLNLHLDKTRIESFLFDDFKNWFVTGLYQIDCVKTVQRLDLHINWKKYILSRKTKNPSSSAWFITLLKYRDKWNGQTDGQWCLKSCFNLMLGGL